MKIAILVEGETEDAFKPHLREFLKARYGKSHGVGLVDALIAATAKLHGYRLVTLNKKHFPMLDNVLIPYQKH
jgi:predicted nucleic acid-binding protein